MYLPQLSKCQRSSQRYIMPGIRTRALRIRGRVAFMFPLSVSTSYYYHLLLSLSFHLYYCWYVYFSSLLLLLFIVLVLFNPPFTNSITFALNYAILVTIIFITHSSSSSPIIFLLFCSLFSFLPVILSVITLECLRV